MFDSSVLDVAIGVAFVFLSVSLICSAVREGIEAIMKSRAMDLERGLRELLNDRYGHGLMKDLVDHPRLSPLFGGAYDTSKLNEKTDATKKMTFMGCRMLPSYIPADQFSGALIDTVLHKAFATPPPLSVDSLRRATTSLGNDKVRRAILSAIDLSNGDLDKARAELEAWFNCAMDRVSAWYKRRTQFVLFAIGICAAGVLNIDAITVTKRLSEDEALRRAVVTLADQHGPAGSAGDGGKTAHGADTDVDQLRAQLNRIGLPIGWQSASPSPQCLASNGTAGCSLSVGMWIQTIIGWLITAFVVMLGAPFWFDVLSKFMVIRATVRPRERKTDAEVDRGAPSHARSIA